MLTRLKMMSEGGSFWSLPKKADFGPPNPDGHGHWPGRPRLWPGPPGFGLDSLVFALRGWGGVWMAV